MVGGVKIVCGQCGDPHERGHRCPPKARELWIAPKRRGRPRVAPESYPVTFLLPVWIYDAACRKARTRDLPLAHVLREAVRLYVAR